MIQEQLSNWEEQQAKNAHHRALIMRILTAYPDGLTTQKIIEKELEFYGYTFLTDNRCREMLAKGWITKVSEKPIVWKKIEIE